MARSSSAGTRMLLSRTQSVTRLVATPQVPPIACQSSSPASALSPKNPSQYMSSWEQLKGKTIFNGPPRGGALIGARQMLQIVAGLKEGKGYKGIQVNWGQANQTIADGSADFNLLPSTHPGDRIAAGQAAGKMRII